MAVHGRKNKQVLLDFDAHVKEIRQQFNEQVKCLDARTENKALLVNDLQEFLRKRAEVESEYAKNLDRLADRFQDRIQRQRNLYGLSKKERSSTVSVWNKLLVDTKFKSKTCSSLSDLLLKNLVARLQDVNEDIQRVSKSVRETHILLQEEVMKQVQKLQQSIKIYYTRHAEHVFAESKLRDAEIMKQKAEDSPNKRGNEKKMRNIDKVKEKHQAKYLDTKMKSTRARNDYILTLEATSAVLSKYYDHDICDIISRSDHNYYSSFAGTVRSYCSSEVRMANSFVHAATSLEKIMLSMDPDQDRLHFLEDQQQTFAPIVKFAFLGHADDQVKQITAVGKIQEELRSSHETLYENIKQLQVELSEVKDGIDETTRKLEETYRQYDSDMNSVHHMDGITPTAPFQTMSPASHNPQIKSVKEEQESYLLGKFREFILTQNLNTEGQARYDILTKALGEILTDLPGRESTNLSGKPPTSRTLAPTTSVRKNPIKLFGTNLEDHVKDSGGDIPDIVDSCIKFITKFGLKHQGIFRVSGTSQDIADMKKAFEDGRNPLAGLNHWKDINAVAGVSRAYFRELKEPLFPSQYFQDYIRISRMMASEEQLNECRNLMSKVPRVNLAVIKYLLKFLHLIASHSEENKMNSHNLAVVFGPTVFRVPGDDDLITSQGQVNVFMEIMIREYYNIFPEETRADGVGAEEVEETEEDGEPTDDDDHSEEDPDVECFEAEALYDFSARSAKELSFKKGDIILVFSRTNENWWDAQVGGQNGFVPARYVRLLPQENERCDSESSGTNSRRQTGEIHVPESILEAHRASTVSSTEIEQSNLFSSFGQARKLSSTSDTDQGWPDPPNEKQGGLRLELRDAHTEKFAEPSPPPIPSPAVDVTSANLFSSIDPTCAQYQSGGHPPRRSYSDKMMTMPKTGSVPTGGWGSNEKSKTMSLKFGASQRKDSESLKDDSLTTTVSAVREAFGGPRGLPGNTARLPAVRPIQISDKDLLETHSRLKSGQLEDIPPKPNELPPEPPLDQQGKQSVKDRSKLFGASAAEKGVGRRPGFGLGGGYDAEPSLAHKRASFASVSEESIGRPDDYQRSPSAASIDSGKYVAPAVKPKPLRKLPQTTSKQQEVIASIHAAAAMKAAKGSSDGSP